MEIVLLLAAEYETVYKLSFLKYSLLILYPYNLYEREISKNPLYPFTMYISTYLLATIWALTAVSTARRIRPPSTADANVDEIIDHLNITKNPAIDLRNDVYSLSDDNFPDMHFVRYGWLALT